MGGRQIVCLETIPTRYRFLYLWIMEWTFTPNPTNHAQERVMPHQVATHIEAFLMNEEAIVAPRMEVASTLVHNV